VGGASVAVALEWGEEWTAPGPSGERRMAVLVPAGVTLRSEFDRIAPHRDRSSDGWIGDPRHRGEVSDHNPDETGRVDIHDADHVNEVHAIDVTANLRRPGLSMERAVQHLVHRARSGAERRLRYVIYNRRIWRRSGGWHQERYHGDDPHTAHAHFSFNYDTRSERDTRPYGLEELIDVDLNRDTVPVGRQRWLVGRTIGYTARTAYEIKVEQQASKLRELAILNAVKGASTEEILAAVNQVAAQQAAFQQSLTALPAAVAAELTGTTDPAQVEGAVERALAKLHLTGSPEPDGTA
jgi:hypothetical protein